MSAQTDPRLRSEGWNHTPATDTEAKKFIALAQNSLNFFLLLCIGALMQVYGNSAPASSWLAVRLSRGVHI